MWNFAGRQNYHESQGEYDHGNWISGISFIDNMRLGNQDNLPKSMQSPAHAKFYFLPLILGLIGLFFHLRKSKKDSWVVFLMFFMTGFAIIIYLNQTPLQPRERDYAYAGSFYAFSIWIGLGVLALYEALSKRMNGVMAAAVVTTASLLLVPAVMATQGWEGHDRSGKYAARDFARMYLESCEPNAILFTNGDNDTFPLWYVQEVEGIRTDVRVVNYMLSSGDWYVDQMFNKVYNSEPLPLTIPRDVYKMGNMNYIPVFVKTNNRIELKDVIDFIADDDKRTKAQLRTGEWVNIMPAQKLKIVVDSAAAVNSGTISPEDAGKIVSEIDWDLRQSALVRNDLLLLDLIASNNWERPIYFANPNAVSKVFNVDKYCHLEGVVYRFKPIPALNYNPKLGGVDPKRAYETLMADDVRWGRLNEDDVVVDRESQRTSGMMKQNYSLLARTLTELQQYDSAVAVMDKGIYFFPPNKFIYDYGMIPWADNYYKANATEKGNEVVREIFERYKEDLAYYRSLKAERFIAYYQDDIQQSLAVLQSLGQLARRHKQAALADEIEAVLYKEIENFDL
jgi:hypothetical protein